jgi:NAD(P)-dependent dehydrogenase (short-subunit alcohol dehydrogenase family)
MIVLITGASSGIGEALAREYVKQGAKVALLARRTDRLEALCEELGKDNTLALTADVTKDGHVERAIERTVTAFGGLDVVVANAGSGLLGHFADITIDDFRSQFELNVFGVLRTAYASLPYLQKSRGSVVLVSSVMGYLPLPNASAYNVSKAAVKSLAESMRVDLSPYGISVTHVAPGFINTELRRVDAQGNKDINGKDPVPMILQMPAPTAARKIIRATRWRQRELVLTNLGKLGVFMGRHFSWLTSVVLSFGARQQTKVHELLPPAAARQRERHSA